MSSGACALAIPAFKTVDLHCGPNQKRSIKTIEGPIQHFTSSVSTLEDFMLNQPNFHFLAALAKSHQGPHLYLVAQPWGPSCGLSRGKHMLTRKSDTFFPSVKYLLNPPEGRSASCCQSDQTPWSLSVHRRSSQPGHPIQ